MKYYHRPESGIKPSRSDGLRLLTTMAGERDETGVDECQTRNTFLKIIGGKFVLVRRRPGYNRQEVDRFLHAGEEEDRRLDEATPLLARAGEQHALDVERARRKARELVEETERVRAETSEVSTRRRRNWSGPVNGCTDSSRTTVGRCRGLRLKASNRSIPVNPADGRAAPARQTTGPRVREPNNHERGENGVQAIQDR